MKHFIFCSRLKSLHSSFNMSITSIENLSNKIFYEIFQYLDGYEIYQIFSNLNHHFQQLINCSSILFKFNYHDSISDKIYTNNAARFVKLLFFDNCSILFNVVVAIWSSASSVKKAW